MKKILFIDDDQENLDLVAEMLRGSFEPLKALSGREGILAALKHKPDVILLDVNMPGMDGFEVCKKLREQPATRAIPIVMLSASVDLEKRLIGLDAGADDYITRPFNSRELIARLHARIRRFDEDRKVAGDLIVGNLRLSGKSHQVWVDGKPVSLTQMEFELLRYFMERPNEIIARAKLLGDLWPDSVVTDRTVDTHMANLRKKITGFDCPLTTIYGAGYILKTHSI